MPAGHDSICILYLLLIFELIGLNMMVYATVLCLPIHADVLLDAIAVVACLPNLKMKWDIVCGVEKVCGGT